MLKRLLLISTLVLLLVACGNETDDQGREILFEERFEASYSDEWAFSGDVEALGIIAGELHGPEAGQAQLCAGDAEWEDYTLTAWFDHIDGTVALYTRFNGWQETYGVFVVEGNANLFTRYDNAPKVVIDSVGSIGADPVEMAFTVAGDQLSVTVDGDPFYEMQDARLPMGSICIELTGGVRLDNVVVTSP